MMTLNSKPEFQSVFFPGVKKKILDLKNEFLFINVSNSFGKNFSMKKFLSGKNHAHV